MKSQNILFTLLFLFMATVTFSQTNQTIDCKILKDIKLRYTETKDKTSYIVIKDNKHVEHIDNDKFTLKSDLEWLNECEYNATLTEINFPDFPFKVGDVMHVKFEKIENTIITGTGTIGDKTFPISFEILK
jgi:hypothetical protein